MGELINPKNSKFIEDLKKVSQEIEAGIEKKKSINNPQPDYNPPTTLPQKQAPVKEAIKENLKKPLEEPSAERLKAVVEELKKAAGEETKKKNSQKEIKDFQPAGIADRPTTQMEKEITPEIKVAEITGLPDLTQERMRIEKAYQELNTLKGKLSQRIELLKTLERQKKEIDKQLEDFHQKLAVFKKENANLLGQIKNKLEKENESR